MDIFKGTSLIVSDQPDTKGAFHNTCLVALLYY